MLNHAMKECPEKSTENNQPTEECKQYGAWMRGEPLRWSGWDKNQTGAGASALNRHNPTGSEPKKPWPQSSGSEEGQGGDGGHVRTPSNTEPSDQTRESFKLDESREAKANLHETGKVKGLVEKFKSKETILDERVWGFSNLQVDKTTDM